MATLCNRASHYIFVLWVSSSIFLSFFRLSNTKTKRFICGVQEWQLYVTMNNTTAQSLYLKDKECKIIQNKRLFWLKKHVGCHVSVNRRHPRAVHRAKVCVCVWLSDGHAEAGEGSCCEVLQWSKEGGWVVDRTAQRCQGEACIYKATTAGR